MLYCTETVIFYCHMDGFTFRPRRSSSHSRSNSGSGSGNGSNSTLQRQQKYLSADDAAEIRRRYLTVLSTAAASIIRQVELEITHLAKVGQEYMFWQAPDSTSFTVHELLDAITIHFQKQGFFVVQSGRTLYISWRSAVRNQYRFR